MSRAPERDAGRAEAGSAEAFWRRFAPFWSHLEDRHFGSRAAARMAPLASSPVLVVGGGHGVAAEVFERRRLEVVAVDLEPAMAAHARARRGVRSLVADGSTLPFRDGAFATVVLSSGVVDYGASEHAVARVLTEAMRVLADEGELLVAFYRIAPDLEPLYRRLGIVEDGLFHMGRLFEIGETARCRPLDCIPKIVRWTGAGRLRTALFWMGVGLRRPPALREEEHRVERLFAEASLAGVDRDTLVATVPPTLPLRDADAVRELLEGAGVTADEVVDTGDCLVARHHHGARPRRERRGDRRSGTGRGVIHVRAERVRKRYRGATVDAVQDVSLSVERGTIFGLLGPNGAGKTTTLSILAGLLEPDRGKVVFDGERSAARARRRMGLVPQELALYPKLTARENLRFFGSLYGLRGEPLHRRCDELLEHVALLDRADERVERFSTGMMRRLNLAAGLVHAPDLILLDEPTVGIDPQSRNRILDLVLELTGRGVTVLYTTHYMEEASRLCDRVAIIDHGAILLEDAPAAMVRRLGTYRVVLLADALPEALASELRGLDEVGDASWEDGLLTLSTRDASTAMALVGPTVALAAAHGVEASLRRIEEPSLESVFLALTGRSMRDGAA